MMNQYHYLEPHTTLLLDRHSLSGSSTNTVTVFQAPLTNNSLDENFAYSSCQPSKHESTFYDQSISENSYEKYSVNHPETAESINHPLSLFDQCYNYPNNNSQLNDQSYADFLLSNNQSQIMEQSLIDRQPIIIDGKYKWMQIKRAPPNTSSMK